MITTAILFDIYANGHSESNNFYAFANKDDIVTSVTKLIGRHHEIFSEGFEELNDSNIEPIAKIIEDYFDDNDLEKGNKALNKYGLKLIPIEDEEFCPSSKRVQYMLIMYKSGRMIDVFSVESDIAGYSFGLVLDKYPFTNIRWIEKKREIEKGGDFGYALTDYAKASMQNLVMTCMGDVTIDIKVLKVINID